MLKYKKEGYINVLLTPQEKRIIEYVSKKQSLAMGVFLRSNGLRIAREFLREEKKQNKESSN